MTTTAQALNLGIHRAAITEKTTVAGTVAAGFFDDPVTKWLLPDVNRRREVILRTFELYVGAYLRHHETYLTASGNGAAVWLPPDTELFTTGQEEEEFGVTLTDLLGADAGRAFQLTEIFAEQHPQEPLYYCQFLATVPASQGRGIGSAFLRDMLRRADSDALPAYHEATSPRNRALYERHGYISRGEITLPDGGPTLWRMWRDPR